MNKLLILTFLIALTLTLAVRSVYAIELDLLGDVGTNAIAKKNVILLGKQNECLLGLGDYQYDKKKVSAENQKNWDNIECKVGVPGNHEVEKGENAKWAAANFGYGTKGYGSWKLADKNSSMPSVMIIGLNPYTDFKKGSNQYDFFVKKLEQSSNRKDISWILVASHPPIFTPTSIGGHGPDIQLRNTFLPLIANLTNVIWVSGHNHITAWGTVQDTKLVICGGGGKGGDSLGKLNGFEFATSKDFGHCDMSLLPKIVKVSLITPDGTVKGNTSFMN